MATTSLKIIVSGTVAGTLLQNEAGLMSFRYDESYRGTPLSLSMPVSNRIYSQDVLLPYLFGLLPPIARRSGAQSLSNSKSAPTIR